MTATWHTPKSWSVGELVTATNLNEQLRDNLEFLKSPPTASYLANEAANYTTTSTSFVEVDGAGVELSLTITTAGGDVLIGLSAMVNSNGSNVVYFDVSIDGVSFGGDDGIIGTKMPGVNNYEAVSFVVLKTGLSAASHTFKLMWKTGAGTATLFAGAGTAGADMHPQFWVREI
jgi:hypothetical protein